MAGREAQEAVDAALDAALDELDEDLSLDGNENDTSSAAKAGAPPPFIGPPRPPPQSSVPSRARNELEHMDNSKHIDSNRLLVEMMNEMLLTEQNDVGNDPEKMMIKLMEKMQTQLKSEMQRSDAAETERIARDEAKTPRTEVSIPREEKKQVDLDERSEAKETGSSKLAPGAEGLDQMISDLISDVAQNLATESEDASHVSPNLIPGSTADETDVLNMLMKGLGEGADEGSGDFDSDAVIDGMMEQLLSKELMYEPMKQVASKFPGWLEAHRDSLPENELKQREKQCECFQKLVRAYEENATDTKHLMELMQDVQEYGQPPPEIIQLIAPDLELDANGLPKMDGTSMPFPDSEECLIM